MFDGLRPGRVMHEQKRRLHPIQIQIHSDGPAA
jgi:hypothetical protein